MASRETEYYEPGDLIFTGEDFAHVITLSYRKEYCDYCCIRNVHVRLCSQCGYVSYCNKQCQKSAWPQHKLECLRLMHDQYFLSDKFKFLEERSPNMIETGILTARVIRKIKPFKQGEALSETFNGRKITFDDIQSAKHIDIPIRREDQAQEEWDTIVDWVSEHFDGEIELQKEEIYNILGKVMFNQAPLRYDKEFGTYLCLGRSFFRRGCNPNAVALPNGKRKYEIRATQRIPKGSPEKIILTNMHILDSYCMHCNIAYCVTHIKGKCGGCLSNDPMLNEFARQYVPVRQDHQMNYILLKFKESGTAIPSNVRAAVDTCLMYQSYVLGCTHLARLRLLVWKVLIEPQDLFAMKHSERNVLSSIKKVYGEQSYELFTVYCRLTAIYASYKKLKIAKHYKEKRDELGCLYHQMPLNFESDALIEKMEQDNVKQK